MRANSLPVCQSTCACSRCVQQSQLQPNFTGPKLNNTHDLETSELTSRMLSWFDRSPSFSRSDHLVRFWIVSKVHAHSPFSLSCTTYRHSGQRQRSLVFVLIALDDAGARGDVTGGDDVCLGKQKDPKGVCPPGTCLLRVEEGLFIFPTIFEIRNCHNA